MSLLPVEEAFRLLVANAAPITRRETVDLAQAGNRVLAADIVATRTQPSFDASAMDGYGVRAADCAEPFAPLVMKGESAAGRAFDGTVSAGECVRIFTGAPLPEGVDAILIQENAEASNGRVRPLEAVVPGQHVRRAGIDFAKGERLLAAGTKLTPGAVALAASAGYPRVDVVARPKVAILATGDELVLPGEPVGPSQIVASNSFGVMALVRAAGGEAVDCGIAGDSEAAIEAKLDAAIDAGADIFVTIGGASVGDHDLVGKVFASKGVDLTFWKVAMRPGKPLMAGRLDALRIVGLPGNPASSMVSATLFLAPLIRRLAGLGEASLGLAYEQAVLGSDLGANGDRTDFMRAKLEMGNDGATHAYPLDRQDSSLLSIYAKADCLIVREPGAAPARAGEPCLYIPLD